MSGTAAPGTAAQTPPGLLDTASIQQSAGQKAHPSSLHSPQSSSNQIPNPRWTINLLLLAIVFGGVFLDYWQYSRAYHQDPNTYLDLIGGTGLAPAQYRIGVLDTASFFAAHTHRPLRIWLALLDLVSALTSCFVLLTILRRSRAYAAATLPLQWLTEVAFIALVQFYLGWLLWYSRPETLPTAAFLALGLLCLTVPVGTKSFAPILASVGLLAVTVAQSFVRADVVFALNLGILVVCLVQAQPSFVLGRKLQALVSLVGILIAVAIQLFLMRVEFPQATYGDTPVFQLVNNLKDASGYLPFLCAMLPFVWAIWRVVGKKAPVTSPEAASLLAACIFTAMWLVVGIAQEVRIFLPYGLLLTPVLVTLLLQVVSPEEAHPNP